VQALSQTVDMTWNAHCNTLQHTVSRISESLYNYCAESDTECESRLFALGAQGDVGGGGRDPKKHK